MHVLAISPSELTAPYSQLTGPAVRRTPSLKSVSGAQRFVRHTSLTCILCSEDNIIHTRDYYDDVMDRRLQVRSRTLQKRLERRTPRASIRPVAEFRKPRVAARANLTHQNVRSSAP
jgi:hypothetical protein